MKNLYQSESLPHLKIYTKISQLSPGKKATGGGNEVNDARKKELSAQVFFPLNMSSPLLLKTASLIFC
jgi:hypothetical protein